MAKTKAELLENGLLANTQNLKSLKWALKSLIMLLSVVAFPTSEAKGNFGVIEINKNFKVVGFEEKPEHPKEIPGRPGYCFVSMGNYLAERKSLRKILHQDAEMEGSSHDFGKDVIPLMLKKGGKIFSYDFSTNFVPGQEEVYWRDVGTLKAFWDANMDLKAVSPKLSLYSRSWPLRTFPDYTPPAKTILGGKLEDSLISGRCIISGGEVRGSVLSHNVLVEKGAEVIDSVLFADVAIHEGARVRNAIVDKGVVIPRGMSIGFSEEDDIVREKLLVWIARAELPGEAEYSCRGLVEQRQNRVGIDSQNIKSILSK